MYALTWHKKVLDALADIYLAATAEERERMADGVADLNSRLRANPFDVGESRSGSNRVAFVPLLGVGFTVDTATSHVWVTGIRRYGR